jgi:hypothetical protein
VRRGARWALGVGLALAAVALSGARAEVRSINLDECSTSCIAPAIDDLIGAEDESAADIPLSLFGGGGTNDANDARPDLIFDPTALPTVLVSGLPSPIPSADGRDPGGRGASPYDFFEDVIDIPLPIDVRTGLSAASILLFTPSLIGRLTLTDVLSNSNALFKRPPPRPAL